MYQKNDVVTGIYNDHAFLGHIKSITKRVDGLYSIRILLDDPIKNSYGNSQHDLIVTADYMHEVYGIDFLDKWPYACTLQSIRTPEYEQIRRDLRYY
jgi:hypothetical protein